MSRSVPRKKLWSGTFLIFGTTVGAGMLGIPVMTAGVGFIPACLVTCFVWAFMLATGLLLMEATLRMPDGANLISLAGRCLGKSGKWVAGGLFFFLYGCLLVAYFSGGAPLLGGFCSFLGLNLDPFFQKILFFIVFGGLIFSGAHWISRANFFLALVMLVTYAVLISIGSQEVSLSRLEAMNFSLSVWAIPVLFSAFGYHNVVPSLVSYLKKDKKTVRLALIFGTFMALVFYLLWQWIVLGTVSLDSLNKVKELGLPVTYALQEVSGNPQLYILGQIFAFLALTTSFLGVGMSFVDFLQDGFREHKKDTHRAISCLLTVVPPFICVLLIPALFEKALGVAGGFGESILNGILPVLLFAKVKPLQEKMKGFLLFLVAISLGVAVLEIFALSGG